MYPFGLEKFVLGDLFLMNVEEGTHVPTHSLAVNFRANPGPLQVQRADFQVPWVTDDDCSGERAV
jgi:hypothetical protein